MSRVAGGGGGVEGEGGGKVLERLHQERVNSNSAAFQLAQHCRLCQSSNTLKRHEDCELQTYLR